MRDGAWIEERLQELADASRVEGGIWRAAYTPQYAAGQALLEGWMREAGLAVHRDAVGNLFGRLEGRSPRAVMAGSHLDTVRDGGRYDGAAGVITALAAVANLAKEGQPEKSLEVAALIEEEGSRFGLAYLGSRAIAGDFPPEYLAAKDADGITMAKAMRDAGLDPAALPTAARNDIDSYLELHIEQGPVLDAQNLQIGVVESIVGLVDLSITLRGQQNHAGTTPMALRRDPVVRAAALVAELDALARAASPTATLTVGQMEVAPGMSNVIAGQVYFSVDMRDGDAAAIARMKEGIAGALQAVQADGFEVECDCRGDEPPVLLNPALTDAVEAAASTLGFGHLRMNSGAGHDAQVLARKIPSGMVFVPSRAGISHSPLEFTPAASLEDGRQVLQAVIRATAW